MLKQWILVAGPIGFILAVVLFSVMRSKLRGFLLGTGMVGCVCFIGALLWGKEVLAWRAAEEENSVESYQAYVHAYPEGRWEAWDRLRAKWWERAQTENSVASYYQFAKHYGDPEARSRMYQKLEAGIKARRLPTKPLGAKQPSLHPGGAPHAIVLWMPSDMLHKWQRELPIEWQPASLESVRLIATLQESEIHLGTYHFDRGPPVTRTQHQLSVVLTDARTGEMVATKEFQNVPREIRPVENYHLTQLGHPVSLHELQSWLRPIVQEGKLPS